MKSSADVYVDEVQEKAYTMSSCGNSEQWWTQTMRCHACVIEDGICTRVNTIQSFQEANRLLPHKLAECGFQRTTGSITSRSKVNLDACVPCVDREPLQGVGGDCLVSSEGVVLGEKVSIKHSCVGKHCTIGDKTKILNCTIMDHVQIGEGWVQVTLRDDTMSIDEDCF